MCLASLEISALFDRHRRVLYTSSGCIFSHMFQVSYAVELKDDYTTEPMGNPLASTTRQRGTRAARSILRKASWQTRAQRSERPTHLLTIVFTIRRQDWGGGWPFLCTKQWRLQLGGTLAQGVTDLGQECWVILDLLFCVFRLKTRASPRALESRQRNFLFQILLIRLDASRCSHNCPGLNKHPVEPLETIVHKIEAPAEIYNCTGSWKPILFPNHELWKYNDRTWTSMNKRWKLTNNQYFNRCIPLSLELPGGSRDPEIRKWRTT